MKNTNVSSTEIKSFIRENHLDNEDLTIEQIHELYDLIEDVKEQNFLFSSDLSYYITKNKLGYEYPNISGVVTMENSDNRWKFKGGFPTNIYRIICQILNLSSQHTRTRVVGFKSYASM